jgi:NIPSNAP
MYVEERMYRLKIGAVPEYCRNYTEVGGLNTMVHMWAYDSLDQREKCRAALQADPAWQAYLAKARPLMEAQETRIMKVAPVFVDRLKKMLGAVK